jgi:hypothetical protein
MNDWNSVLKIRLNIVQHKYWTLAMALKEFLQILFTFDPEISVAHFRRIALVRLNWTSGKAN